MGTIAAFGRKLDKVNLTEIAGDILQRNSEKLKDMNIQQLMQGLDSKGKQLSPKYSEDPYFKSRESAMRYARWKKKLFPDTPFDVPNLIIVGVYHNSIAINRAGDEIQFSASASFAGSVAAKYGNNELGLSPDNKVKTYREIVKEPLVRKICQITGAKMG